MCETDFYPAIYFNTCVVTANVLAMTKRDAVGNENEGSLKQATVQLPVPAPNPDLFRHKATNDLLRLLLDNPYETFTLRKLSRLTGHTTYSVKSAVDVLEDNDLILAKTEGNRRPISINRTQVSKPNDPILQIPQPEFHEPVRVAVNRLQDELADVRGILVFGSVARGRADRQSDIDLWALVEGSRGEQHRANEVIKELEQHRFDGQRYEFQILVESAESAGGYIDRLTGIFVDAITLYESETLTHLKQEVLTDAI